MPRPHLLALPAAAAVLALAACSSGADAASSTPGGTSDETSAPAAAGTQYPLTLDNCGTEVTFDAAPERVVTIKSSTAETMLALGLGDRIVGAAFLDGAVPEWLAADAEGTAVAEPFSDEVPGTEAVLELEPDLVYAGWESNVSADGAGDRDTLASLGVNTYVAPAACKDPAYMPNPLTFEDVWAEIREVGAVFDVAEQAEAVVAEQRTTLDAITPDDRGLDALWYSSGSDIPYVGAGIGAPQMILDAVGLANVAGDVEDTWTSMAWEEIVDADPDVIVLVDAAWNSAEDKITRLEENPATARLGAVQDERYLVVPFPASEAGVRNADAAQDLSEQLAGIDIDG
ncbi:iron complex transport system substrate-binding protein [Isoptericola sp. CG 20/1183]|uniref:Iron complex transport system substrate-binding protein n=1 Tax=Isoptericola halotolerans TaxID=300560 RepID=A0ABX5ECY4_9MICO|nr:MULTISPECIES: putative F420-0 ABC transporter substrate-binding protein [Isoptericola]PRZ05701.1 iron complex transport system substrate-binding protein [Isoptericola halotolerans]PRZ06269.1 iron complex transport system substrate-binding protein [Isoptericola sp. CG 20/1183]